MSLQQTQEHKTRHEKLYELLRGLGVRIGNVVYGSVAFDLEIGNTRHQINSLIDEELASSRTEVIKEVMGKIEGMKRRTKHTECILGKCEMCDADCGIELINKTVDDVLALLEKEIK